MPHRADEFSLRLSWTPKINGGTPVTPGFYLRALFANEGEAMDVVRGSRGGVGSLVGRNFLEGLFALMERDALLVPNAITGVKLGRKLADHSEAAQTAALAAKRTRLERLRAEIAELEREVAGDNA